MAIKIVDMGGFHSLIMVELLTNTVTVIQSDIDELLF